MIRAWRAIGGFEGRSSMRSWLYRIAQNVCTDMHRSPQRRARPMEMGPSTTVAAVTSLPAQFGEHNFVQPIADDRVLDPTGDPAEVAAVRESIRLAFVAALQHLPARQRSVLILCEVLEWQATEVAELDTSVASVNSALQRARATLADMEIEKLDSTLEPGHDELLARYVDAFERYDIPALVTLLRDDVILSMPPFDLWLVGPEQLAGWFLGHGIVCEGGKLLPVRVNGGIGFGDDHFIRTGLWKPWAIQIIEVVDGKITGHHNFLSPALFPAFGLPMQIEG